MSDAELETRFNSEYSITTSQINGASVTHISGPNGEVILGNDGYETLQQTLDFMRSSYVSSGGSVLFVRDEM